MLKNCSKITFIVLCMGIFVIGIFLGVFLCANMSALKSELPPPPLTLPLELIEAETEKAQAIAMGKIRIRTTCDRGKGNEKCIGNIGNVLLGILDQGGNLITSVMTDESGKAEAVINVPSDMRFIFDGKRSTRSTITIVAFKKGYVPMVNFNIKICSNMENPEMENNISMPMKLEVGDLRLDEPDWIDSSGHFHRLEVSTVANNVAKMLNFDIR